MKQTLGLNLTSREASLFLYFCEIIIKHQNLTPNGFKGLITHVGTILDSHLTRKHKLKNIEF